MTIIYEVNLTVQASIAQDYLAWLQSHIKDMLNLPGFLDAQLFQEVTSENSQLYVVHYKLDSQESLDKYIQNHAPAMRQEGIQRFGNKFSATRRVMQKVNY